MINLDKYLQLNESLIKGNVKIKNRFLFPVFTKSNKEGYEYHFIKWRSIKIPENKNFVIYRDYYHNCLHIADMEDMIYVCCNNYDDFEDFDAKDIIATFSTLKEAAKYAMKDGLEKYYESESFCDEVFSGKVKDSDFIPAGLLNPLQSIECYTVDNIEKARKEYKNFK